jgi:hypothetical protein
MYVSWSELTEMEWMWYACAFWYTLRGTAVMMLSWCVIRGRRRCEADGGAGMFVSDTTRSWRSNTFQSLIVLSAARAMSVRGRGRDAGARGTDRWWRAGSAPRSGACTT